MHRRLLLSLVAAALCALLLTGCGAKKQTGDVTANPWAGTQVLTAEGHKPTLAGTTPALYFRPDGTVIGNATVNAFRGKYTLEGRSVKISQLVATQWAAPQMESQQDALVLDALRKAARYRVANGVLELSDGAQNLLMSFKVASEPVLVGPVWACAGYASAKGDLVSTVGSSPVSVAFAPDGTLAGFGGANQYTGEYKVSGSKMTIGPNLAVTQMAGSEPLVAQEAAYLDALSQTAAYKIQEFQLSLLDNSGSTLAVYIPVAPK